MVAAIGWVLAVLVATSRVAVERGWWDQPATLARAGGVVATWFAVIILVRRTGGRYVLIGLSSAVVLGLVVAFPQNWALAGAAATAAGVHGILGMVMTRPAPGLRSVLEVLVSAAIGLAGAFVVTAYGVDLRAFRFRVFVLVLVLVAAFAIAWRLGYGTRSLGRRGVTGICGVVAMLAASVVYTQAIRQWGSPELVQSLVDAKAWVVDQFVAVPRPIEAFVGFPALVWGVAIRSRRRQGWWLCAFGALGAAGTATALVQQRIGLVANLAATGYDVAIGSVLGLVIVALDRVLTEPGGRRAQPPDAATGERLEPARLAPLL